MKITKYYFLPFVDNFLAVLISLLFTVFFGSWFGNAIFGFIMGVALTLVMCGFIYSRMWKLSRRNTRYGYDLPKDTAIRCVLPLCIVSFLLILIYLPHWFSYLLTHITGTINCVRTLHGICSGGVCAFHTLLQLLPVTDLVSACWIAHLVKRKNTHRIFSPMKNCRGSFMQWIQADTIRRRCRTGSMLCLPCSARYTAADFARGRHAV